MTAGIVGRDEELRLLADALDVARPPTAIVLAGDAGIGKTTLWRAGVELARERSYRVLASRPVLAEAGMPFAGLGDLLTGCVDEVVDDLPSPQRRALEAALLLAEPGAAPPRPHEIAQAALTSLRVLASREAVLVAVDDVQWLDPPSAEALRFALRRIGPGLRLSVLLGWRTEAADQSLPLGLDEEGELAVAHLGVGPLSLGALQRLTSSRLGTPLARPALVRVHETSGGNPFFALELARALIEHGGAVSSHAPLPVPSTLAALLEGRLAGLPAPTREALELAALAPEPTAARIAEASRRSAERVLPPAVGAGVVVRDGEGLRFSHPLIAAALVAHMSDADRRRAHRRLAATSPTLEERAIHLARGAHRPEETVASVIEEAATRIARRGAPREAAELLDEAARLTPVRAPRGLCRRLLLSGRFWHRAFDWGRARECAQEVLDGTSDPRERAEALLLLAMCGSGASADELLRETSDHALRARAWAILANHQIGADLERALDSARNAVAEAELAEDPVLLAEALALLGFTGSLRGEPSAPEHLARGIEIERRVEGIDPAYSPTLALAECAFARDELDEARELFEAVLERAAATGDDAARAHVLWVLAYAEYKAGRWGEADALLTESHALHRESGHVGEEVAALHLQAMIEACRGDAPRFEACCTEARRLADQAGLLEETARQEQIVRQLLDLGYERYEQAASYGDDTVVGAHGWIEPGMRPTVANRIEALAGAGRLDEAEGMLEEWEDIGRRLDRPRALATGARCRGLLLAARDEHEAALASLEQAVLEHERLPVPFERARTLLALGAQRRRLKRRAEAREALEQALAIFEELGARPWAERARRELGRIPGRRASDRDELTESERRIAELVAEGRSNKEVAAALFLSVKTVEVSLTRVYRKLGVRSRAELARRFSELTAAS